MSNPTEGDLLNISSAMYGNSYSQTTQPITVKEYGYGTTTIHIISSTSGTSYENNGLQASVIKIDNQTVVAFRGSQSMGTTEGNKDWLTDAGLNNPQGYQDASSQFKDADAWIKHEQQAGNLPKDMSRLFFTGYSLGGSLAQYEATKNDAYAVSFTGPSLWNMLKMKMANEKQ